MTRFTDDALCRQGVAPRTQREAAGTETGSVIDSMPRFDLVPSLDELVPEIR